MCVDAKRTVVCLENLTCACLGRGARGNFAGSAAPKLTPDLRTGIRPADAWQSMAESRSDSDLAWS
jgi:hypothetical protein